MNKAAFLDRDGVINKDLHYIYKPDDIIFCEGIFNFTKLIQDLGYLIFIVTNQSGIGKGLYSENDFYHLSMWLERQFAEQHIHIQKTYFSGYDPSNNHSNNIYSVYDRKPNPGMIIKAQYEYNIDLSRSFLNGDKDTDIQAGLNARLPLNILINRKQNSYRNNDVCIVNSLKQAEKVLIDFTNERSCEDD
ncbi:MAG: D-glycero-alpha-D-manno-heptose-1,7-bisphosphate 7-phosphatase, partial [Mobilitalea sp.]